MSGPLDGIRVFDLTRVLAGPTCTQIMGDLGADVIKVERPGAGDDTRGYGPPFVTDAAGRDTTESAYYTSANRNKRSLALDLTSAAGQDLARRLIGHCQVLIENFKFGSLAKYGLAYDQLKDEFPGLIYCSITGFGQTGPRAPQPGYDFLIQGMGGFMSITGEPGGEPQKAGIPIADLMAGMWSAVAINAALRHLEATGEGQQIDIGMLDTQIATLSIQGANYLSSGVVPERLGNAHPNIVPYQVFSAADGDIVIAVGNDAQFGRFCDFAGVPELADDDRFRSNDMRVRNRIELTRLLNQVVAAKPAEHWLKGLERINVASGPINTLDKVFADPQTRHREMEIEMKHPLAGDTPVKLIGSPIKMSATPVSYRRAPPTLGQHTDEVLRELLGLEDTELAALRGDGVI